MTGIQHFSQHIDRTESACIRWILAIGFATMMGPWLHTSQDVRPPPAPSPQSAGGLAFHQLGKRSSRFCNEDLFCARWGQAGAVEKKMKHPFFPTKHVFFSRFYFRNKDPGRLVLLQETLDLAFWLTFQVAQMLELYRHILRDCHVPSLLLVGCPFFLKYLFGRLGTLLIPSYT